MASNFYDKVAQKFGNYQTGAQVTDEFPNGNPEAVFKEKLIEVSGRDKVALDVGCADGRFTLSIANSFLKIKAIDTSNGMLESARKLQQKQNVLNVEFVNQDIHTISFCKEFDVIYSRRGPIDYPLFYRALKSNGKYVEIDIGEKDAMELKQIFGRGQNYGRWNKPELQNDVEEITNAGFQVIFAEDYLYNEYYKTYQDLDLFLQGVPIFEDYDSNKDRKYLEEYVKRFKKDKGIILPRHRIVMAAKISLS